MSTTRTRFLQRRSYRRRRIADAARLLPVAGIVLLLLPLLRLGGGEGGDGARTSQVGLYVFAVWLVLMAVAFFLSRNLQARGEEREGPDLAAAEDPDT